MPQRTHRPFQWAPFRNLDRRALGLDQGKHLDGKEFRRRDLSLIEGDIRVVMNQSALFAFGIRFFSS